MVIGQKHANARKRRFHSIVQKFSGGNKEGVRNYKVRNHLWGNSLKVTECARDRGPYEVKNTCRETQKHAGNMKNACREAQMHAGK